MAHTVSSYSPQILSSLIPYSLRAAESISFPLEKYAQQREQVAQVACKLFILVFHFLSHAFQQILNA